MSRDNKIIAVDADSLVYMAGYALRAMPEPEQTFKKAKVLIASMLRKQFNYLIKNGRYKDFNIARMLETGNLRFYLTSTDKTNFRFKVATIQEYKSSRKDKDKPLFYHEIREYLYDKWRAQIVHGMEADDILSILASQHPDDVTIVHVDKDLRQIPRCYHLEMNCERKIYYVNPTGILQLERTTGGVAYLFATGKAMVMSQMITGDTTDDIPRLTKGYGPVKIYDLLTSIPPDQWEFEIMNMYHKEFGVNDGELRYHEVYKLVSLLTAENYQDEVKTIKITKKA